MIQQLASIPDCLATIKSPPKQLYVRSADGKALEVILSRRRIAIVGSRSISGYGKKVTRDFANDLAAPGLVVVSGLAIGVDAIAHQATLDAGGQTIAVLPSPVNKVYPRGHWRLAEDIIRQGGALISEYHPDEAVAWRSNFVARNRLVSGLADALLITEATADSGTLHTAKFAAKQGKKVFAIPGDITSPTSLGTNGLISTGKAMAVTSAQDILDALANISPDAGEVVRLPKKRVMGNNEHEQRIIGLLEQGVSKASALLTGSGMTVSEFNRHLTMLEITAKIQPLGGDCWALA